MLAALRYFWVAAKGYRWQPWRSPYIRWRLETYFGAEAAELDAGQFFRLLWRERRQMRRFFRWAEERRQHHKGRD